MNKMNLPENIVPLDLTHPTKSTADPYGNVLYFCKQYGWIIASYDETEDMISNFSCTHWTFTPPLPL
jgi:hypothetical protein